MAYTTLNKTELTKIKILEQFSESVTVSLDSNTTSSGDYIVDWRFQTTDSLDGVAGSPSANFYVTRLPGTGYPTDCGGWTRISLKYLKLPQKTYQQPTIARPDVLGIRLSSGVTYPEPTGGSGQTSLSGTISGEYTRIVFPCDRITYLDNNSTDPIILTPPPNISSVTQPSQQNFMEAVPDKYDHISEFRLDPTEFVDLTYKLKINLMIGGNPETEYQTLTHRLLPNTDGSSEILRHLIGRQRTKEEMDAKYEEEVYVPWTGPS